MKPLQLQLPSQPPPSQEILTVFGPLPGYHFDEIPGHLQDNECVRSQYRAYYNWKQCWQSILGIHNESGNIWTHLLGAGVFIYYLAINYHVAQSRNIPMESYGVQTFYIITAVQCLLSSSIYHTFSCQSKRSVYDNCAILDYSGISSLICGSFLGLIYYGLYCHETLKHIYMGLIFAVALAGMAMPWFPFFRTIWFRPYRTVFFVLSGVVSAFPVFHTLYLVHDQPVFREFVRTWPYGIGEVGLYLSGAWIYANRYPERWYMRMRRRTVSTAPPGSLRVVRPSAAAYADTGVEIEQDSTSTESKFKKTPSDSRHRSLIRVPSPDVSSLRRRYKGRYCSHSINSAENSESEFDSADNEQHRIHPHFMKESLGEKILRRSNSGAELLESFVDSLAHADSERHRAQGSNSELYRMLQPPRSNSDDSEGETTDNNSITGMSMAGDATQASERRSRRAHFSKESRDISKKSTAKRRTHQRRSSSVPQLSISYTADEKQLRRGLVRTRMPSGRIVIEPIGPFDVWGTSHQIWHICVLLAALCHYVMVANLWTFRHNNDTCSVI